MADFEICVMNANGSALMQLTNNTVFDASPTFSRDGKETLFHENVGGNQQVLMMNDNGTQQMQLTFRDAHDARWFEHPFPLGRAQGRRSKSQRQRISGAGQVRGTP